MALRSGGGGAVSGWTLWWSGAAGCALLLGKVASQALARRGLQMLGGPEAVLCGQRVCFSDVLVTWGYSLCVTIGWSHRLIQQLGKAVGWVRL